MKSIAHEELLARLRYDPHSGYFTWIDAYHKQLNGLQAGTRKRRRFDVQIGGKSYAAHRLAWFYMHGVWPHEQIDHIDGNAFNNALANLREATASENNQNRKVPASSRAGLLGTTWHKGGRKWQASIQGSDGVHKYLGLFDKQEDAHAAYLAARRALFQFQPVPRSGSVGAPAA